MANAQPKMTVTRAVCIGVGVVIGLAIIRFGLGLGGALGGGLGGGLGALLGMILEIWWKANRNERNVPQVRAVYAV
jgi:hypothetical protein